MIISLEFYFYILIPRKKTYKDGNYIIKRIKTIPFPMV